MSHSKIQVVKKYSTSLNDSGVFGKKEEICTGRHRPEHDTALMRPRNPKLSLQWQQGFSSNSSTFFSALGKKKESWKRLDALKWDELWKWFLVLPGTFEYSLDYPLEPSRNCPTAGQQGLLQEGARPSYLDTQDTAILCAPDTFYSSKR